MPWIFLTLMLANIVYFGWNFISTSQAPVRPMSVSVAQEGARIMLLSERKSSDVVPVSEEAIGDAGDVELESAAPEKAALVAQCFNVGPFQSPAGAERFMSKMVRSGLVARIEERKAEGKDYWVYVPPFTNRARAEERLRELRAKGIESFIVAEGAFVNAISLGHFSKKELAQDFRQKMTDAGVVVEFREMPNEGHVNWVYVAPGASGSDSRKQVEIELGQNAGLRKETAACEE